jgi:hypothetical protein
VAQVLSAHENTPGACRSIQRRWRREASIDDVATVKRATPTFGRRFTASIELTVQANGQLTSRRISPLIVAYRNGAPVALRDLGDVVDSVEISPAYNGQQAVTRRFKDSREPTPLRSSMQFEICWRFASNCRRRSRRLYDRSGPL